jgi:hypothetical protein
MGVRGYVLSYLALNGPTPLGARLLGSFARYWEPPGVATEDPGVC